MSTKKLKVQVLAGRKLAGKNNGKSDPYCELVVLDDQGNKIGKAQVTKVIKGDLNPAWNQLLEFSVPSSFSGLKVRCWDKHRFRSDKFLGQVTIKFNTALLQSSEKLDDWFTLNKRKSDEEVSGDVHLQIIYGDLKTDTTASPVTKTERSSTLVGETPNVEVRVSAAFTSVETDKKLQTSTHTVVAEDEEPTDSNSKEDASDYEKVREGPSAAALDVFVKGDKDLAFTNKNLEVTSNSSDYYKLSYAKGNVAVNGGKWYYEVRIQITGQMQIGWASTSYNPKNNTGDIWAYDGSRQQKLKNGSGTVYGEYWTNGDIIGVGLDLESKTIQYWRNGKDLGAAFTDVTCGAGRLVPVFGLVKRAKIAVNFGKDTYAFPQSALNMLHCFLSEKEIDQLSKLFLKYKDISNEENEGAEPKDSIHGQGLLAFQKSLGASDDEDPTLLLLAWKLKCETLWEISREEFMNGFTVYGCAAIDKIKYKVGEWKDELKDNTQFRNFYNFVFDYLKEDKKILLTEDAIAAWKIVLKDGRKWGLFNDFVEFLNAESKKSISRDAWQQLWHFMNSYPTSLKDYDVNSSWPIIYDEFVDWMEAQGRKNR